MYSYVLLLRISAPLRIASSWPGIATHRVTCGSAADAAAAFALQLQLMLLSVRGKSLASAAAAAAADDAAAAAADAAAIILIQYGVLIDPGNGRGVCFCPSHWTRCTDTPSAPISCDASRTPRHQDIDCCHGDASRIYRDSRGASGSGNPCTGWHKILF